MSSRTAVMSLQNGATKDDALRAVFGADRVLGALCYIGATIVEPGVVKAFRPPDEQMMLEPSTRARALEIINRTAAAAHFAMGQNARAAHPNRSKPGVAM